MTAYHGAGAMGAITPQEPIKEVTPTYWDASFEDTVLVGDGFDGERIEIQADDLEDAINWMQQLHRDMCESDSVTHDERTIVLHGFTYNDKDEPVPVREERRTASFEITKYGTSHAIY